MARIWASDSWETWRPRKICSCGTDLATPDSGTKTSGHPKVGHVLIEFPLPPRHTTCQSDLDFALWSVFKLLTYIKTHRMAQKNLPSVRNASARVQVDLWDLQRKISTAKIAANEQIANTSTIHALGSEC
jgi:hypothetical protein